MRILCFQLNSSFFLLFLLLHSFVAAPSFCMETNRRMHIGVPGKKGSKLGEESEVYPTGSTLPDCTHACGACSPCKRVMVSFKCSVAESCPVVYRCMCNGKYYHVPSNA